MTIIRIQLVNARELNGNGCEIDEYVTEEITISQYRKFESWTSIGNNSGNKIQLLHQI